MRYFSENGVVEEFTYEFYITMWVSENIGVQSIYEHRDYVNMFMGR